MRSRMMYAVFAVLLMALLSACNVYDFTHAEGDSDDVDVLLSDAASAQANSDYAEAARIYWKILGKDPDNSLAMRGYTTAIVYRDVVLSDIPKLMTSIFKIETLPTADFLGDVAGMPGMTVEQYKANMLLTMSNASYWRSYIHGINPVDGTIQTNASGLPDAAGMSDGKVAADNRTAFLNYLILKSAHIALFIQQEFWVNGDILAGINVPAYTNSYSSVSDSSSFQIWHINYTNAIFHLSNSYITATNVVLGFDHNTSLHNLVGTVDAFIAALSNQYFRGDISIDLLNDTVDVVDDLKTTMWDLESSLTNNTSGVQDGFAQLATFRSTVESYANGQGWMPY